MISQVRFSEIALQTKYFNHFVICKMNVFKRITESLFFQLLIITTIVAGGVQVGLETQRAFAIEHQKIFQVIDWIILSIFVIEAVIKILAEGRKPWNYFKDGWNIFDFSIVVICLLAPFMVVHAEFVVVLRLVRIIRLLRIITILPDLQLIVGTLLRSIPSMFYLSLLLILLFYMYGTMGVFLFADNDPIHFQNLPVSMLSMFRVATLEDWTDIMYINMYGSSNYGYTGIEDLIIESRAMPIISALFFCSFVAIGTMIVLNLVIGVILNSMDETKKDRLVEVNKQLSAEGKLSSKEHLLHELEELTLRIHQMKDEIRNSDLK